jgi:hypothetical protein
MTMPERQLPAAEACSFFGRRRGRDRRGDLNRSRSRCTTRRGETHKVRSRNGRATVLARPLALLFVPEARF